MRYYRLAYFTVAFALPLLVACTSHAERSGSIAGGPSSSGPSGSDRDPMSTSRSTSGSSPASTLGSRGPNDVAPDKSGPLGYSQYGQTHNTDDGMSQESMGQDYRGL